MADLTTTTSSTGFSQSVTDLVVKQLVDSLRAGLPWTPKGSIRNAVLIPGTNGLARFMSIKDLPTDPDLFDLNEGVTPEGQDLAQDYINVQTAQKGGFVRLTDLAQAEYGLGMGLAAQAAEKITRQAQAAIDGIARAAYAALPVDIYSGTSNTAIDEVSTGDVIDEDDLINAVATLRTRGVKPLAGGFYVGVASPQLLADVSRLDEFVTAAKFAKPELLLKGAVGEFRGIQFVEVLGNRAIVHEGAGTGSIDVHRLQLIGADALAFGDLTSLEVLSAVGATSSDPLAQRQTVGWKARLGATIIAMDEVDSGETNIPRTVSIASAVSF